MTYKVAGGLLALRTQLDRMYPRRSKAADGFKASSDHTKANPNSDHEPWYRYGDVGYVTAADFTHDPRNGLDCNELFDRLWASRDKRIKYIIWDREITSGNTGPSPWYSRGYKGSNPHTGHLHVSVMPNPDSLVVRDWELFEKEDDLKADEVWGFPVHDLYTPNPTDTLPAGVAMEWAAANAGHAKDAATAALRTAQRVEQKLDDLIARLGK